MPVFCNISSAKWSGENGLLGIKWRESTRISLKRTCAVRFQDFIGRMKRDHRPMMWRKCLDLAKPLGSEILTNRRWGECGLISWWKERPHEPAFRSSTAEILLFRVDETTRAGAHRVLRTLEKTPPDTGPALTSRNAARPTTKLDITGRGK
jgi:hypothetical protein